ncbi:hypothetical protein LO763_27520 [Glycomyces sp. A-F 0318]|uniref:hypothetical protein n=1 Tax=Glycomyces amatae TaxID=2881355 RepID=UPI001E512D05|nr:hypothetical protein [Glycomyces amatae]MCD0447372.1 hypothetical protein [Glycomyces amatae]
MTRRPPSPDSPTAEAVRTFNTHRQSFIAPASGTRHPLRIRPHPPAEGDPPPSLRPWLRNAAIATDGRTLTLTGRDGRARDLPIAVPGTDGAASLLIVREHLKFWTRYGHTAPQLQEYLCILDPAGRRLVEIDLYGWTRTDLTAFAAATGLRVDRYAPPGDQVGTARFGASTSHLLDRAVPRAPGCLHLSAPVRRYEVALIIAAVLAVLALYGGLIFGLSFLDLLVPLSEEALIMAQALVAFAALHGLVVGGRRFGRFRGRRREKRLAGPRDRL